MWQKIWDAIKKLIDKKIKPKPQPEPQPVGEDLDISNIKWLGRNYSSAKMEKFIRTARMDNSMLYTDYTEYNWPVKSGNGVVCDAIFCLFYERDGKIVGGKFDWSRKNGQRVKTLENVHHGYQGHSFPEPGAKVWMCLVSVDTSRRSNIVSVSR